MTIGLAVEGGGMRGVVSAAMLTALEDQGLGEAFDVVYGSSAGAVNAAYFVAGNCRRPLRIYAEDLPNRQFLDFTRCLRGRSILDLDFVFDEVLGRRKPLDYDRILAARTKLAVVVTDVDRQRPVTVKGFQGSWDLRAALRASCWLPGAVKGTAEFRGERAVDGSVLAAHPWTMARADGCTHILSLSTHRLFEARRYSPVALRLAMRYLDGIEPGLGEGYRASLSINQGHLADLDRWMTRPAPAPYVLDLGPLPGSPPIKRHETDTAVIEAASAHAYGLVVSAVDPAGALPRPERTGGPVVAGSGRGPGGVVLVARPLAHDLDTTTHTRGEEGYKRS